MSLTQVSSNVTTIPPANLKDIACSQPIQPDKILHTAFLILILIVTFVGNLLVVLAVIFFRRLRSIGNYFVVSLAVSDLLVALLSVPFKINRTVHNNAWCLSQEACEMSLILDTVCSFASIWNLAVISVDRYIAITHPFRYHSLITTKVGYGLICFVWGYSSILAITCLLNWTNPGEAHIFIDRSCQNDDRVYYTTTAAISFFLPLAIVLVMYSLVFRVALNQARALAALQIDSRRRGGRRSSINLVREVKAAKTLAIVVGCFIVCWLPFAILVQISLWNKNIFAVMTKQQIDALNITFILVLPALNSTMNPIIYAMFNREFRTAFWKLVKRLTGRRLGAVGFGVGTATNLDSSGSVNHNKNGGPSRTIHFKTRDSDSTENAAPTVSIRDPNAYYNDVYNSKATGSKNNNLNATPHGPSKVSLDIDNGLKEGAMDSSIQNGSISSDEERSPKVDKSVKLPPLERALSFGNGNMSSSVVKLPPIKPNNLSRDNIDSDSTDRAEKRDNDIEDDEADERNSEDSQLKSKDNDSS